MNRQLPVNFTPISRDLGAPIAPPLPPTRGQVTPAHARGLSSQIPTFEVDLEELVRAQKPKPKQTFVTKGRLGWLSECPLTRSMLWRVCGLHVNYEGFFNILKYF